jgi:methyltransferase (TIGR00027 family)
MLQFFELIWQYLFSRSNQLNDILSKHDVATTAPLTNYWKDVARQASNWEQIAIQRGSRTKDLYKDPLLSLFYNQATAQEAQNRLDIRMWLPLATRSKYFRKTLSHLIKTQNIKQVIILGSGFDTLAARKQKYTEVYGVQFFEIDHEKILNCKAEIYASHAINTNARYIGMDYTTSDFITALRQASVNLSLETFVLWEGNTFYLEKDKVLSILETLRLSFDKLVISFDFMHPQIEKEEKTIDAFAKRQSPFKTFFVIDEIMTTCERMGLNCYSHFTTDVLAIDYQIDKAPYHTAKPYSVITFQSCFFKDQAPATTVGLAKPVLSFAN